jgi:hypothetical protein
VNETAQLYTIEGIAAGILMITTVYLVLNTTTIYTPGDSHISDLQLEQLGNDALAIMNTPDTYGGPSDLQLFISETATTGPADFNKEFLSYVDTTSGKTDIIKYNASVYYYNSTSKTVNSYFFVSNGTETGKDHKVRVTRFVTITAPPGHPDMDTTRPQAVLLEVLLWRN